MVSCADLPWFILPFNKNLQEFNKNLSASHHFSSIGHCSHETEGLRGGGKDSILLTLPKTRFPHPHWTLYG